MATSSEQEAQRALLAKYLDGQCTAEEAAKVESWYQSFEMEALPQRAAEKRSLSRVKNHLSGALDRRHGLQQIIYPLRPYLRIAAILLVVVTAGLRYYFTAQHKHQEQEYYARQGELKTITLPDGTEVSINGGSRLKITSGFNGEKRQVSLTGEAFFKVAEDAHRPFLVSTGKIVTRVLGTTFNVQAYDNERNLTVSVATGKVAVCRQPETGVSSPLSNGLLPGQQLIYNKETGSSSIVQADITHVSAWQEGIIYFDNATIAEIVRKMERKYNLHIDLTGPEPSRCRYTFRFSNETSAKALEILVKVSGARITSATPDHITLNTTACN